MAMFRVQLPTKGEIPINREMKRLLDEGKITLKQIEEFHVAVTEMLQRQNNENEQRRLRREQRKNTNGATE